MMDFVNKNTQKKAIVRKYNLLIDGSYTFTAQESRLVNELAVLVDPKNDTEFKTVTFDINDLAMRLKLDSKKGVINEFVRILKTLGGKQILVPDPKNPDILTLTPVLEKPTFDKVNKTVSFCLAKEFEPYLLEKRIPKGSGYTLIDTNVGKNLDYAYETRFYEYFQRYLYQGGVYIAMTNKSKVFLKSSDKKPLVSVQYILNLKEGQYAQGNSVKRLIERVAGFIRSRSMINFNVGEIQYFKKGRAFSYFYVPLEKKDKNDKFSSLSDDEILIFDKMVNLGVKEDKAFLYLSSYFSTDKERIEYHLKEAPNKKNPVGWFVSGMEKQDCRPSPSLFSQEHEKSLSKKIEAQNKKNKELEKLEVMRLRKEQVEKEFKSIYLKERDDVISALSDKDNAKMKAEFLSQIPDGYSQSEFKNKGWSSFLNYLDIRTFLMLKFPQKFTRIDDIAQKYKIDDWQEFLSKIQ